MPDVFFKLWLHFITQPGITVNRWQNYTKVTIIYNYGLILKITVYLND